MDREAWQATVHGVTKSQTQLSDFHFQLCLGGAVHIRGGGDVDEYYSALSTVKVIGLWMRASSLILQQGHNVLLGSYSKSSPPIGLEEKICSYRPKPHHKDGPVNSKRHCFCHWTGVKLEDKPQHLEMSQLCHHLSMEAWESDFTYLSLFCHPS